MATPIDTEGLLKKAKAAVGSALKSVSVTLIAAVTLGYMLTGYADAIGVPELVRDMRHEIEIRRGWSTLAPLLEPNGIAYDVETQSYRDETPE